MNKYILITGFLIVILSMGFISADLCKGEDNYYHDCGPIDPFLEKISEFKSIDLIHSGPFSNYKKVGEFFCKRTPIELHLRPVEDFVYCSEEDFRNRLLKIREVYSKLGVRSYYIRLTSYSHPELSVNENMTKLKKWCDISNEILLNK